jgi:ElaB/YqjD/DUF883 family membrane-anchored ribosome-binding protein
MEMPNFTDMQPEDLLSLIETAEKVLDQKIAAEKAELEARRLKLEKLEARRGGKVKKAKAPAAKPHAANGRAAPVLAPKPAVQPAPQAAAE